MIPSAGARRARETAAGRCHANGLASDFAGDRDDGDAAYLYVAAVRVRQRDPGGHRLTTARRNNPRNAITGALICRHDVYLQLIEGDAAPIDALFARISADDRHLDVTLLNRAEVADRVFPDWAMLHDPARSWLWSPDEVEHDALREATPGALRQVFTRAAADAVTH